MTTNKDTQKIMDDVESTLGYISIKDFAYDENNPLRYGYVDDTEESILDNEFNGTDITQGHDSADILGSNMGQDWEDDKRNSIVMPQDYIINQNAIALYDFEPENDNELPLVEGDRIFISYRHGQGWLVAETMDHTRTGLVPEEFVEFLKVGEDCTNDNANNMKHNDEDMNSQNNDVIRPFYLTKFIENGLTKDLKVSNETSYDKNDEERIVSNNKTSIKNNSSHNNIKNSNETNNDKDDEWEDIDELGSQFDNTLHISNEIEVETKAQNN